VLCGSALSAMAGLLTGNQALRGRASLDVVIRAFDFRTTAGFWGITDPATAFLVNAVLGGTPGYRDLLPAAVPKRPADAAKWLAAGPLNPASALCREDDYLLAEERSLPERALYHSVITAIAEGHYEHRRHESPRRRSLRRAAVYRRAVRTSDRPGMSRPSSVSYGPDAARN
jgi:uncharacterized protein